MLHIKNNTNFSGVICILKDYVWLNGFSPAVMYVFLRCVCDVREDHLLNQWEWKQVCLIRCSKQWVLGSWLSAETEESYINDVLYAMKALHWSNPMVNWVDGRFQLGEAAVSQNLPGEIYLRDVAANSTGRVVNINLMDNCRALWFFWVQVQSDWTLHKVKVAG